MGLYGKLSFWLGKESNGLMTHELRIIIEKVSVSSQEVVKRDTIKVYDIQAPESITDLGLRHSEQISLLEKVQNSLLAEQSVLIDTGVDVCPNCGEKLKKFGYRESDFHAVFSDHKLRVQKHICSHVECGWQSSPSIKALFGTNIHPDLAKLQCEQGALYSYREAEQNLEKLNCEPRRVNNHTQVKRITNKVGEVVSEQNCQPPSPANCAPPALDLIVQVDGGHIPIQDKNKRSFEALSAVVYRPENLQTVDKHHRQLTNKTCVISAKEDKLQTMKTYVINAALKQGISTDTHVTALADGANNCWSVLGALQPYCGSWEYILDWFHIRKKFQSVKQALRETFEESLTSAKWKLWHGQPEEALAKLALLRANLTDDKQRFKIIELYNYIESNQTYIVNYEERAQANKTYTSQVAESHIESLINARQKRSKKMQWTREGAHQVLQIRAKMESKEWKQQWQVTVLSALGSTA